MEHKEFAVKIVKEFETRRGVYWEGGVYRNGKRVGTCWNEGNGGQTRVEMSDDVDRDAFRAAAAIEFPTSPEAPSRFAEELSFGAAEPKQGD